MGARNRGGIRLSYRPSRLHRLVEFIPWNRFLGSIKRLKIRAQYTARRTDGFIEGILRWVRCTKSLRVLFLHRRPPSWTTLVLYSRAVFIFNEPACSSKRINILYSIKSHWLVFARFTSHHWQLGKFPEAKSFVPDWVIKSTLA
jgi:hypothetical protein